MTSTASHVVLFIYTICVIIVMSLVTSTASHVVLFIYTICVIIVSL